MEIRISNRQKKFRIHRKNLEQFCMEILKAQNEDKSVELDLSIVDDNEIAILNEQYLQHTGATDVISFPQRDSDMPDSPMLGDVVVSADQAYAQGNELNTGLNREFGLYIIHGILHLLGYDDLDEQSRIVMTNRQEELLNLFLPDETHILLISEQKD